MPSGSNPMKQRDCVLPGYACLSGEKGVPSGGVGTAAMAAACFTVNGDGVEPTCQTRLDTMLGEAQQLSSVKA